MRVLAGVVLLGLVCCAVAPAPLRGGARGTPGTPQPTGQERDANGVVITRNNYDPMLGMTSDRIPEDNTFRGTSTPRAPQQESRFDREERSLRESQQRWEAQQKREAEQKASEEAAKQAKASAEFAASAPARAAAAENAKKAERERMRTARGGGPKKCGPNMRCLTAAFCKQYGGQSGAAQDGPNYEKCSGSLVCCDNVNWNAALSAKGKKVKPAPVQSAAAQSTATPKSNGPRDCIFGGGKCVSQQFCNQNKGRTNGLGGQAGCKGKLVCCVLPANAFANAAAAKKANKAGGAKRRF